MQKWLTLTDQKKKKVLQALIVTQCNNRNWGQSLIPVVALDYNESLEDFSSEHLAFCHFCTVIAQLTLS